MKRLIITAVTAALFATSAIAQESDEELAKKLANPIASLISVPFVFNYDENIGPADDGTRSVINIQPVIPFSLNSDWNIISRTILPIIHQDDIVPGSGNQFGLGDTLQSLFFSPKTPTSGGLIWGVGPVFLLPTATDDLLGGEKVGLGPNAVALMQKGPWTIGGLANHVWSVAGNDDRADISNTFLQPFVSYTTRSAWTYSLNTESTYDWNKDEWAVPVNAQISKLLNIGGQPISIGGGARYWIESAGTGPEGWGATFNVKLLFPKN